MRKRREFNDGNRMGKSRFWQERQAPGSDWLND